MTRSGSNILVDVDEVAAELPSLLKAVEEQGQSVQICRDGKPIAALQPVRLPKDPLQVHPHLKATYIAPDAFAPLTEDEWPEELR